MWYNYFINYSIWLDTNEFVALNYQKRQEIVAQALEEISFARIHKQGKTQNWKTNEDLYYGRKRRNTEARSNVDLGQMASFVHTLLSKIDAPLTFKFVKRKQSQIERVDRLNSLKEYDRQRDNWDIKDIVGKKQAIIYGRTIYCYSADSVDGYQPHLDNVDVYDFLIDPSAGGVDIERANYMGRYGVVKYRHELKDGVKNGLYLRTETNELLDGKGNPDANTQEETNKRSRTGAQGVWQTTKEIDNADKYKFWEWYTTYEGTRYYLLLSEQGGTAIRVEPLTEIFQSGWYPFWTWAAFMDLTEFWTPSYCDYVREVFMAQAISINQMLDNAEQINKPQRVIDTAAIENLAELKYRRDGFIKVKPGFNAQNAVQTIETPSIKTPIEVFNTLEGIQEKASGVTAGAKGVSDEDKVGIYEGNQANAADRFGLLNKSYSFGYHRFAKLWEAGVKEHLIKKVSIDILGPDGLDVMQVSRRDLYRKTDEYSIQVESSAAELAMSSVEKRTKIAFLSAQSQNPAQNPMKAYEIQAKIAGFDDEVIKQLLDKSDFGNAEIMSEAERDIERLLDGEQISPNESANTAYKQRFVDYMLDHKEDISQEQFDMLAGYVASLDQIIFRNMQRMANDILMRQQMAQLTAPPQQTGGRTPQTGAVAPDVPPTELAGTPYQDTNLIT